MVELGDVASLSSEACRTPDTWAPSTCQHPLELPSMDFQKLGSL